MQRRAAIGVLAAVGLAAVAFLLWPEGPRESAFPPGADAGQETRLATSRPAAAEAPAEREPAETFDGATSDAFLTVVSSADGAPVPGAEVHLRRAETRHSHMRWSDAQQRTDARGRVSFPALPVGEYDLSVYRDFFEAHYGLFASGATVALEPILPVHGRVLSASRVPVAGALVSSTGQAPKTTTTSGPDGRFELAIPSLDFVVAEKNGVVGFSASLQSEDIDRSAELEIVLDDGDELTLLVLQRNEAPLAGVSVELEIGAIRLIHTTGSDGVFRVPWREGAFVDGHFSKPGYVPVRQTFMFESINPRGVRLSRPTQLAGVLLDTDGRAVDAGTVIISEPFEVGREHPGAPTDGLGRFSFKDLDTPWVELTAVVSGREARERIELPEGTTVAVKLVLRPELSPVNFEVITAGGYEVMDYELVASPVPFTGWTSRAHNGSLELNRGRFRFEVTSGDGRSADVTLDVEPTPGMQPLRIMVRGDGGVHYDDEAPPVQLEVRVVDATGAPVAGAEVDCYGGGGQTAGDGRVSCLAPAIDRIWPLHVIATKGSQSGMTRATGKESEVVVVVRSARAIRGRVVGQLPAADLWLEINSASGGDAVELKGNSFSLENRPPIRTFVCVVHAPKEGPGTKLGCAVSEGDEELVIPVGAPGTLTFSALDDKGAPMEAPIVYVDRVRQPVTPSKGVVKLPVAPGHHVLVLNQEASRARTENRFTIVSGQTTALGVLRLQ